MNRLIVIRQGVFRDKSMDDFLYFITKLRRVVEEIDRDSTVKDACEKVSLKECNIVNYKSESCNVFHQDILDLISDTEGTEFLIFNN